MMIEIPGYMIDGLHYYFHSKKGIRKSRYIKPVFRRLAKKFGINKTNPMYKAMFKVMILS